MLELQLLSHLEKLANCCPVEVLCTLGVKALGTRSDLVLVPAQKKKVPVFLWVFASEVLHLCTEL
jgi:hypothetical protein